MLEIEGMDESYNNLSSAAEGWLTISHNNKVDEDKPNNEALFYVNVRAKQKLNLKDKFKASSLVTRSEAYRGVREKVDLGLASRRWMMN